MMENAPAAVLAVPMHPFKEEGKLPSPLLTKIRHKECLGDISAQTVYL